MPHGRGRLCLHSEQLLRQRIFYGKGAAETSLQIGSKLKQS
jgi:hypothetical protein